MINDPALSAASRRLLHIERQLEALRADIAATDAERTKAEQLSPSLAQSPREPAAPDVKQTAAETAQPPSSTHRAPQVASALSRGRSISTAHVDAQAETSLERPASADTARIPSAGAARGVPTSFEALLSGRGLAVSGVLLILIGCAFFLDLSFTRGWIGPGERIALGLVTGAALLGASTRFLRGIYRHGAEAASGLGAGIMYLACWAALAVFPNLNFPHAGAFAIMAVVACGLTLVANRWRSEPIALMGLAGAYLTPILLGHLQDDRAALAAYVLVVTSGLLVLARRRAFVAVEITAVVSTLFYGLAFLPSVDGAWTNAAAATVATCDFLLFAIAFTTRPIGHRAKAFGLLPFILTTSFYVVILENLLNAEQTALAAVLAGLATLLLAAPNVIERLPAELKPAYRCLGLLAGNVALRSLLHRSELFDAFSIEAAVLTLFGARRCDANITKIGIGFFAIAAVGLLWNAATDAPAQTLLTPLILGFLLWLQGAFAARRAIPQSLRIGFTIAAHGVALAGLTRAALDATGGAFWNFGLPSESQVALSLTWALFGALLFARGVAMRADMQRWEGLALFAVTIIKVFTVDLASLDITYRMLAFLGTGVVLFGSSAWYMRSQRLTPPATAV